MHLKPTGRVRLSHLVMGLFCVCLLASGCKTKPPDVQLATVEGKVVHQKKGIAWVLVRFHSKDPSVEKPFESGTDAEGNFKLECPPGDYRVTVTPLPRGAGNGPGEGSLTSSPDGSTLKEIPSRYRNSTTSPLHFTVPEDGTKDVSFEIP